MELGTTGRSIGGHHRATPRRTRIWLTPLSMVRALGSFDLDPCGHADWPTAALRIYPPEDGLSLDWYGRCFVNPPYGPDTSKWIKKLAFHGNGIALIFARTETKIFFPWVWDRADGVLFLKGRINFYLPNGMRSRQNAGGPSVLIGYGLANAQALKDSGLKGKYLAVTR